MIRRAKHTWCVDDSAHVPLRNVMKFAEPDPSLRDPGRLAASLGRDDVHVWSARIFDHSSAIGRIGASLAEDEQIRAGRFRFRDDRLRYLITRGLLRMLAGWYLSIPPRRVRFSHGTHGKPELLDGDLRFNVSHSNGIGLLAFARQRDIGVDVEWLNRRIDTDRLAEHAFSGEEYAQYRSLPSSEKRQAFFACWTRKEAFMKGVGKGLALPPGAFAVSMAPGQVARLLRIGGSTGACRDWTMHSLTPCPGYVGAVLARGRNWKLSCLAIPVDVATALDATH